MTNHRKLVFLYRLGVVVLIVAHIIIFFMQGEEGMSALIYGGTGAVGSELIKILLASPRWSKVHCVARHQLEQWNKLPGKEKLTVEVSKDFDQYFKGDHKQYEGFSSLFCCLGASKSVADQAFIKVDRKYPLYAADIAIANKIPHYLLVSSLGSNARSWFTYPRVKGQVQEGLKLKKLNLLSIFKPGILRHRKDARITEKIFGSLPFVPAIESKDCAAVMKHVAEKYHEQALKAKEKVQIFENKDMLKMFLSI